MCHCVCAQTQCKMIEGNDRGEILLFPRDIYRYQYLEISLVNTIVLHLGSSSLCVKQMTYSVNY